MNQKRPLPYLRRQSEPRERSRYEAFAEAFRQINLSLVAVALVAVTGIFSGFAVEKIKFQEQRRLSDIERAEALIPEIFSDISTIHSSLVSLAHDITTDEAGDTINITRKIISDIPKTRRIFISIHTKMGLIIGVQAANLIINLDPLANAVDHSEIVTCSPEHRVLLDKQPSLFNAYYAAACSIGGTAGERTINSFGKDSAETRQLEPHQKKNLDVVYADLARFEDISSRIEYLLLQHIDSLK